MRINTGHLKAIVLISISLVLLIVALAVYREWQKRQVVPVLIGSSVSNTQEAPLILDLTLYFDREIKWDDSKFNITPDIPQSTIEVASQSVQIRSSQKLALLTDYTLRFGYKNLYGWKKQSGEISFTTRGQNQITQRAPVSDNELLDLNIPVSLTFLYPQTPGTIEYEIIPEKDVFLSYSGRSVVIAPTSVWDPGTSYRITLYPNALTQEEDMFDETTIVFSTLNDSEANAVYLETLEEEKRYEEEQTEAQIQAAGDDAFTQAGEDLKKTNPEIRLRSELPYVQADWSMQYLYSTSQYVVIYQGSTGEAAARSWLEKIGFTPDNVLWVEQ